MTKVAPTSDTKKSSIKDYIVLETLHSGANGEVSLALSKKARKKVVIKRIDEFKVDREFIKNEVRIGTKVKHTNLVKIFKTFQEEHYTYLEMEYLQGCDLYQYMEKRDFRPITEKHGRLLFKQIVKAVRHMHKRNIVHRDLKLENIIVGKKDSLKLIDFGMAEQLVNNKHLSSQWCGSTDYVCPEILTRTPYSGFKADVWSLGVILYTLLYSEFPFLFSERVEALQNDQPHPIPDYPSHVPISAAARDLIQKMLEVDADKRISLQEVWNHKWMKTSRFQKLNLKI
jgi:serine/threonine protein kinase